MRPAAALPRARLMMTTGLLAAGMAIPLSACAAPPRAKPRARQRAVAARTPCWPRRLPQCCVASRASSRSASSTRRPALQRPITQPGASTPPTSSRPTSSPCCSSSTSRPAPRSATTTAATPRAMVEEGAGRRRGEPAGVGRHRGRTRPGGRRRRCSACAVPQPDICTAPSGDRPSHDRHQRAAVAHRPDLAADPRWTRTRRAYGAEPDAQRRARPDSGITAASPGTARRSRTAGCPRPGRPVDHQRRRRGRPPPAPAADRRARTRASTTETTASARQQAQGRALGEPGRGSRAVHEAQADRLAGVLAGVDVLARAGGGGPAREQRQRVLRR